LTSELVAEGSELLNSGRLTKSIQRGCLIGW
jgi:hypothetical protein